MDLKATYTAEEFASLVDREDEVERKTGVGQEPLQEALVALSNTSGGVIFVGVQDDGTVVGRRHDQGTDDRIHEAAMAARNVGRYFVSQVEVAGRAVVAIRVERREEGIAQTSNGRVLVRRGGHNVAVFSPELERLLSERALRRFEQTDSRIPLRDAEDGLLTELGDSFGWSSTDGELRDRLRERGLLTRDETLTIAGALFLTHPEQSLSQSKFSVDVRRFTDESDLYDRREEFLGPVHHQVAEATRFIVDELGSDTVVTGLYRHELPRLPEVVIREAIANAVAHRSYEAQGTAVVVELRPDRAVITSPGGLPEPVTEENLRQAQAARNHHVIDVLRRLNLAEDAGRGVDVMQDTMAEQLLDPPRFEDLGHAVRVTLPLRGPITSRERAWVSDLERRGQILPPDRILLVHAARGEKLTNAKARDFLNLDRVEARAALQRLRDAGLIRQIGARGGASYLLSEDVAPPAAFRMSSAELDELILDAAAAEPVSNESVRELTGLDRRGALRLLQRLVSEGRLRQTGERRGTRYSRI